MYVKVSLSFYLSALNKIQLKEVYLDLVELYKIASGYTSRNKKTKNYWKVIINHNF